MDNERQENSPLDEGSEMIAHSAQAAYAVSAAVKAGGTAAGAAAGTAMAGPLGTLVGLCLICIGIRVCKTKIVKYNPDHIYYNKHPQISEAERSKFCKIQTIRMRYCRS